MMAEFGTYSSDSGSYWHPDYGDIDWSLREGRMVDEGRLEELEPTGIDTKDGLVVQLHQENSALFLNEVDPDMDMIAILDPRDGLEYIWFRGLNKEDFPNIQKIIERSTLKHISRYPLQSIVQVYLERVESGTEPQFLEELDDEA